MTNSPLPSETRSGKRDGFPTFVLGSVLCFFALSVHAYSLLNPFLFNDDFDILLKSWTWDDTVANLWKPVNEHSWPLTRLGTYAVARTAGRPTALPFTAAVSSRVTLVACMLLAYLFVRRELGHPLYGLAAVAAFGISATYQEAVYWFAASPALPALATALLALLAAQRGRRTGRIRYLVLSALWSALAPGWFAGGILVGPLCCLYLIAPDRIQSTDRTKATLSRWTKLIPLAGSLAFLAVSLPLAGETILHSDHYGSKTAIQAFDPATGLVNTGRSIVDNLALGSLGIAGFTCPLPVAMVALALLTAAGVWWWKGVPERRLLLLGLGFILMNYVLIYSARARWDYATQLYAWSRYNVFPQMGVAFLVCSGLTHKRFGPRRLDPTGYLSARQIKCLLWSSVILFAVHLPRGTIGSPRVDPEQRTVLRRVEEMDARCREHHIAANAARSVLEVLPIPGDPDNAWNFLRGSPNPQPVSEAEARRLLQP